MNRLLLLSVLSLTFCSIGWAKGSMNEHSPKLEKWAEKHQRSEILKFIFDPKNKFDLPTKKELIEVYVEPFFSETAQRLFLEATALQVGQADSIQKLHEAEKLEKDQPLVQRELLVSMASAGRCTEAAQYLKLVERALVQEDAKLFFKLTVDECQKSMISVESFQKYKSDSAEFAPLIWQRVILRALDQGHLLFARDKIAKLKTEFSTFPEIFYLDAVIAAQLKRSNILSLQKYKSMCTSATTRAKQQFRWSHQFCAKEKLDLEPNN